LLRVFIDSPNGINLDDCVKVSNQVDARVHCREHRLRPPRSVLAGTDRPLVKEADFVRFDGERALVKLHAPLDGRKRFTA